jgi:hypothetical protein
MPWTSTKQRGWGHTPAGIKALGGPAKVAEWDHASKGKDLPERKTMNKGYQGSSVAMAAGGPVLGRTRDFMKTPDEFTGGRLPPKQTAPVQQDYGSKGAEAKRTGDKSLSAVKPRK